LAVFPACSDKMKSAWTDKVDKSCPLPEYPRPQMRRDNWLNLNGEWDYAITSDDSKLPEEYDGKIIVPFSPETELSEVGRSLKPDEYLWYHRRLRITESFSGKRLLLNFGAVDYEATLFVNCEFVVRHSGGYLPFCGDITEYVRDGIADIVVLVSDHSDTGETTRGKQKTKRGGIWYTPQSGIWQTVWMEAVPESYVKKLRITPDFDAACVDISAVTVGNEAAYAQFDGKEYLLPARIEVPDFEAWSPENPKLYDFSVSCGEDRVESYFAMRKFSVEMDEKGVPRLFLNNEPYFHNGLLDQGYWPDGLYTAPTDKALIYDIVTAKAMGFNMLRKHIKVEPMRWYYHCDRLGMLVWQDMPNGGGNYNLLTVSSPLITGIHFKDNHYGLFARKNNLCLKQFEEELVEMIEHLYNCPCICMWVPFNEGWGQFDAARIYELVRSLDSTRPVDHASGWHDQGVSDIVSLHVYFKKYRFKADKKGRAVLLSEFGGYNLGLDGHRFNNKDFGYKRFKDAEALADALRKLYQEEILPAKEQGLSAAVYTQLSDVEDELNGLVTYDRKVIKIPADKIKEIICVGK